MKQKNQISKKHVLLFFIFLLSAVALQAQSNSVIENITIGKYDSDWKLFQSAELVNIYCKYTDCSDPANGLFPEKILIKVENKTARKIYVYWNYALEYNNEPTSSASDENLIQLTLEPEQSAEGNCDNLHQTRLGIFYRYIDREDILTGFQFNNLSEHKLD